MRAVTRGISWLGIFIGICVAPLVFALVSTDRAGQGFWTDFSIALGFVGLSLMGIEFALVARVKTIAQPFGTDAMVDFHRYIGYAGLAFVLVHIAISAQWEMVRAFTPTETPSRVLFGALAAAALVLLVATSVWRQQLRLSYEVWQLLHAVLAVVAIVAAVIHILLVNYYIDTIWKQVLWSLMTAAFVWLIVWVRVVRPLRLRRRPWTVAQVSAERDSTTVLTLSPVGHPGMRFEPGQFAWITVARSPFSLTSHPFSFCSSAETTGSLAVAIKAAGDFSAGVADVKPGTEVFVDGPHGVFSIDEYEGAGFCFIAGGVGIAPSMGMLQTLVDRDDPRPAVLFAGNRDWDSVIFRDRVEALSARPNVTVVHVLERPPENWTGESGYLNGEILTRHLPANYRRFQFFACGPNAMLAAVEKALVDIGTPAERIHTEKFDWV